MSTTRNQKPEYRLWKPEECQIIEDRIVRFSDICVHEFTMGDVEDPDLYASQPLLDWERSESGQWVMEHAVETPYWVRMADQISYGYRYRIMARLSEPNQTFFRLKFR